MPRYVALLRGISPLNARMPELKRCFELAGFTHVRTVLSSGNVVFDGRSSTEAAIERKAEAAMRAALGRSFHTIVRPCEFVATLLQADPYAAHAVPPHAKRVVTFSRDPLAASAAVPIEREGASIVSIMGREAFTAYVPNDKGPVFMKLIESTFGSQVTTRTWETLRKCAAA